MLTKGKWTTIGGHLSATGLLTVAGNASMNCNAAGTPGRFVVAAAENAAGYITVKDSGQLLVASDMWLGGYGTSIGGQGILNVQGGLMEVSTLYVGYGSGGSIAYGEVNMTGGKLSPQVRIRAGYGVQPDSLGRGVIDVSGGLLEVAQEISLGYSSAAADRYAYGTLDLSSGTITNYGTLLIGYAPGGTGEVFQTGGYSHQVGSYGGSALTKIGWDGGVGSYILSNGTFLTYQDVYVGGYALDSTQASTGTLEIAGGTFTLSNDDMVVGDFGKGTLTIGPSGALSLNNLTLTNDMSTLRFECGPTGVGSVTAAAALNIDPDAKLEVDVSALAVEGDFVLVDCASRSGSFSPANITITGPGMVWVDQASSEDITLHRRIVGTILTIR